MYRLLQIFALGIGLLALAACIPVQPRPAPPSNPPLEEVDQATMQPISQDLIAAAEAGDLAAVEALLAQGADVHATDGRGRTMIGPENWTMC